MIRIIEGRGTGKTSRLMLLAKENNCVIVCSNPRAMEEKARCYGIDGLQFISYFEFLKEPHDYSDYYIDELEPFLYYFHHYNGFRGELKGYTISLED